VLSATVPLRWPVYDYQFVFTVKLIGRVLNQFPVNWKVLESSASSTHRLCSEVTAELQADKEPTLRDLHQLLVSVCSRLDAIEGVLVHNRIFWSLVRLHNRYAFSLTIANTWVRFSS